MDFEQQFDGLCEEIPFSQSLSQVVVTEPLKQLVSDTSHASHAMSVLDRKCTSNEDPEIFVKRMFHATRDAKANTPAQELFSSIFFRTVKNIATGVIEESSRQRCILLLIAHVRVEAAPTVQWYRN